jgi:recombination protein RecA
MTDSNKDTAVSFLKLASSGKVREAEFDIMFNEGISKVGDILDIGVNMDIITKRGAFFTYGDVKLGQGRENGQDFLRDQPEIANEIEGVIRANVEKAAELARAASQPPVEDDDGDQDAVSIAESIAEEASDENAVEEEAVAELEE